MRNIVDDLHYAISNDPSPWDETLYKRAADEIEHLRSLITAWANSLDNNVSYTDHLPTVQALRKAVGR